MNTLLAWKSVYSTIYYSSLKHPEIDLVYLLSLERLGVLAVGCRNIGILAVMGMSHLPYRLFYGAYSWGNSFHNLQGCCIFIMWLFMVFFIMWLFIAFLQCKDICVNFMGCLCSNQIQTCLGPTSVFFQFFFKIILECSWWNLFKMFLLKLHSELHE